MMVNDGVMLDVGVDVGLAVGVGEGDGDELVIGTGLYAKAFDSAVRLRLTAFVTC